MQKDIAPEKDPQSALDEERALACEVLQEARIALMMSMRFLDAALWRMPIVDAPKEEAYASAEAPHTLATGAHALATDGHVLSLDAPRVLDAYAKSPHEAVRDMLHVILHCVLRHPFDKSHADPAAWSLACDIAVETAAVTIAHMRFPSERDERVLRAARALKEEAGSLAPFRLYRIIAGDEGEDEPHLSRGRADELRALFSRDAHRLWACWPNSPDKRRAQSRDDAATPQEGDMLAGDASSLGRDDDSGREQDERPEANADASENAPDEETADEAPTQRDPREEDRDEALAEDEAAWEEIGKQVEIDLQTYSRQQGDASSELTCLLAAANRKPCDYAEFLRRFSSMAEETKVNDEEFDYIFYTLGLERYGNMPLIEPLEYQEIDRIREFVVAIDTSGSCSGALVQAFIEQTYEILCESSQFEGEVNVRIIQCDSAIQSDSKISSVEELERYRDSFEVRGFGGTDFRPVFEYVGELIERGEFENLKGLVYFTDGMGTFPASPPPYETAFAFVGDGGPTQSVPPWAMKVVVDEERLLAYGRSRP